ncbi:MAG: class I SAM-dependent methyltransferase [Intrasporangium sp.]|uniref:class I SAM-dependent methyltransferase n=1 Tax=Intrasporangium sp. TaxID=1925024 RepID=UPI002648FE2E|nr:class I SAM-dependent methyltransferase [Intrasporangium sp.]MDN5794330.1 class I SAM-dependent methyltransferase [Intrasporangium sp.]
MTTPDLDRIRAFAEQVGGVITGGATTAMMVLGDRLGLYAALARSSPATSTELAEQTGTHERYVREWLAQQTAVGFVTHDATEQTFTLPREHAAVLASDDSPAAMIGAAPLATGLHRRIDEVVAAFRSGDGIPWAEQDPTIFEQTERFFRTSYRNSLVPEWIPALAGVHEKLTTGACAADIGCGRGAALILLADAYPQSRFVGFDVHEPSVVTARKRAADAGVSDRVTFEVAHCHGYPQDRYDLVMFFDAFHDLGDPLGAGAYARAALTEDGTLMLVEPRAGDDLTTTIATVPVAALGYAASTFLCMPNSLSQPGGAALGALTGERRLREVLVDAGFQTIRRVAENPFNMVLEAKP